MGAHRSSSRRRASGCRRILVVLVLATAHALLTAHAAPAASFYGTWPVCQNGGYALETQAWWQPLAGAPDPDASGHVHVGVCFPINGTLAGPAPVDVVVQLHNNPSKLVVVRWGDEGGVRQNAPQSFSCATDQCQLTVPLTVDPALMANAGWREIRFTADTRTLDGQRMLQTSRWCVNVANGKPVSNYCGPADPGRNGGAGWYTGVEYTNVWIDDATFPYQPVKGTWCFRARFEDDRGFASIDPSFHAHPPNIGTVLYDDAGLNVWRSICLDTTTLTNGVHTLHLRTDDASTAPAPVGTASGVYTIKFTVANAASPPPPPPDRDGDGVPDSSDACPDQPGPASNNGCPTDTTPPTAPGQFAAGTATETTIPVSWEASTDETGVAGYRVYRDGALVTSVTTGTSYTHTGLACATTYALEVRAYDAAGNVSPPAAVTATTAACPLDDVPPSAPANLQATGSTGTSVSVAWDAASDNVGVTRYQAYLDNAFVADVGAPQTSYTYAGLLCGTSHTAQVKALDANGNASGLSAPLTVTTAACPPSTETLTTTADSYVASDAASANFGAATLLQLDGSPVRRAYIRFTVRAAAPVTAKLRVFAATASSSGIQIARTAAAASTSWLESTITNANAPAPGATIASKPTVTAGWNEIPIPVSQLDASGSWTFVISRTASTRVDLQSKENANRPQIVLTY